MKRTRNILLWTVTLLFWLCAAFFAAIVKLAVGIVMGVAALLALVAMLLFPARFGLQKEEEVSPKGFRDLPSVFEPELCLVGVGLPRPVRVFVDRAEFTIGRSEECDCFLDPNTVDAFRCVSRRHAVIRCDTVNGGYTVTDCGSHNGTRLNGESLMVGIPHVLDRGDLLQLADVCFRLESASYPA